jgi:ribosomal protein S3AE
MFNRMGRERRRIIKSITQLVYFMRGSVQYNHMMNMSLVERQIINEFIEERLEAEGKKVYPIY